MKMSEREKKRIIKEGERNGKEWMKNNKMKKTKMNKRGAISIIVIIGILASLISIISFLDVGFNGNHLIASITGSGGYIERPVFKYVKCEALGGLQYSTQTALATNGQFLPKPSVASSYNVIIKTGGLHLDTSSLLLIAGQRIEYYICNSQVLSQANCRSYSQSFVSGTSNTIIGVKANEYVWAQYQKLSILTLYKWKEDTGATYQIGFVPYGIREYNVLSGSAAVINPNDCEVPSGADSWTDRVLSSNSAKINSQISKNVNERVLMPEEVRWFVAGYLTSAAPSFALNYKGQDAWCRSTGTTGEIYKINTISLGSGTYKVASPDWSDYLGSETCCPGSTRADQVCSSSFTWQQIAGSQCGAFKSCGSADWQPYSSKQIIKYSCVNGYCKSQTQDVVCANDYDCQDSNQLCDKNTWKCVQANVNLNGQVIKTIPDNKAACDLQGGKWITQTTEQGSLLTLLGITKPKVIVKEYCEMKNLNWIWYIVIGAAVLVFILLFGKRILMIFRVILAKIGVKI